MTDIAPGTITRDAWNSRLWPIELHAQFLSKLLVGSPFASSLTAAPTSAGRMVWPLVSPEGAKWLAEAQRFPTATLNDETYEVAVCKLGGMVQLSNESISDTSYPISQNVGRAIADSCGPILDHDFLYGEGSAIVPKGVWTVAPEAAEAPDFRAAAIVSWGELADVGAQVPSIIVCARPSTIAREWSRVDNSGQPLHADAATGELTLGPGIRCLPVPQLEAADVLALDTSVVFRVMREDFRVDPSDAFEYDSTWFRVKGRFTVAAPVPEKSLRKVKIAAAA